MVVKRAEQVRRLAVFRVVKLKEQGLRMQRGHRDEQPQENRNNPG